VAKMTSSQKGADKRKKLTDIGTEIFTKQGFNTTGLDEVVRLAAVPKGSFYYYFHSKDDFARAVIENYANYFARKLDRILLDQSMTPLQRLRAFAVDASEGVRRYEFKRGCLIGNLGQEMATIEDAFRLILLKVVEDWRERVKRCITEAMDAGEIRRDIEPASLAKFFWSAWEGAVLCAKLEQSTAPLDNINTLFFDFFLTPPN